MTLIANVSHELRTLLTDIGGYLEGMIDGLFPKDDEAFAHLYQELRRLVEDLQALSRANQACCKPTQTPGGSAVPISSCVFAG